MGRLNRAGTVLATLAVAAFATACDQDKTGIVEVQDPASARSAASVTYEQIDRLGNPLVSEVMLEKRLHSLFNTTDPITDPRLFRDDLIGFVTGVAGRDPAYAAAVADALVPDMLMVYPNRAGGVTAANADGSALVGWLTYALAPGRGYGGRKLDNDDAVDKGLGVIFGAALGNTNNVSPGLTTDNVPDPQQDPNTFPYVAAPF